MGKLLWPILFLTACTQQIKSVDGVYKLTEAKLNDSTVRMVANEGYTTIKVMKNGYWIIARTHIDKKTSFEGGSGGTYQVVDGKLHQKVMFSSLDKSTVGKTYSFSIKKDGNKFIREGSIDADGRAAQNLREEYEILAPKGNIKDTSMEGVWDLVSAEWFGTKNKETDFAQVKIYVYPNYAWVQFKPAAQEFLSAGGGTYQFDGKNLTEFVEYFSSFDVDPANHHTVISRESTGLVTQKTRDGAGIEVWKRKN